MNKATPTTLLYIDDDEALARLVDRGLTRAGFRVVHAAGGDQAHGVTLDLESFREVRDAVPRLLDWKPDPERIREFFGGAMRSTYAGKPGVQDPSDENVRRMAGALDAAARKYAAEPAAASA